MIKKPTTKQPPPKQELARRPETALNKVPEHLRDRMGDRSGTEDIEQRDLLLPRLNICQALTPQKKKSNPNYIEGLAEGQLFNTVTGEIYEEPVSLVPLFFYKSRIKFHPLDQGGGIDCQAFNGKTGGHYSPESCETCQFSQFKEGEAPECTLIHNFPSLIFPRKELVVLSFKSTGLRVSRQFNSMVRLTNLPMFARVYDITVTTQTGAGNEWYQYVIKPQMFTPPDFFKEAEDYFKGLREKSIQIDTTGLQEETEDAKGTEM